MPPVLTPVDYITLVCGAESIEFRNPEFGNNLDQHITRIFRESRGGKQIVYSDANWPKWESFTYNIRCLIESKRDEFLAFVDATLGKEITLTNYESIEWVGFLIPGSVMSQEFRTCGWTLQFTFEGERQ
jgi:hypothetical protein